MQPFAIHLNTPRVVLAYLKKGREFWERYVPEMGSNAIFGFYKSLAMEVREYSILLTDTVSD
jgi:hypothetical protein